MPTAILVDGGFYRKKMGAMNNAPEDAARDLYTYCLTHLKESGKSRTVQHDLYRIFFYDCPPVATNAFHPLLKKTISLKNTPEFSWMNDFIKFLQTKRKMALRLGRLSENDLYFGLKYKPQKELFSGSKKLEDLILSDFELHITQKGVDMKIGIDIASLSYKKQVDQIVLISGDSDFVPAAKLARREGIDFILDSLGNHVPDDLMEHIDGLKYHLHLLPKKKI